MVGPLGSGTFCGVAEMCGRVNYDEPAPVQWPSPGFRGHMPLRWIYVCDLPAKTFAVIYFFVFLLLLKKIVAECSINKWSTCC